METSMLISYIISGINNCSAQFIRGSLAFGANSVNNHLSCQVIYKNITKKSKCNNANRNATSIITPIPILPHGRIF